MQGKPNLSIVLDKRSTKKSGGHPVKLMVTWKIMTGAGPRWVQKYYSLGAALRPTEFDSVMGKPRVEELKALRRRFDEALRNARDIVDRNQYLTPEAFDRLYTGESTQTVGGMFALYVAGLKEFGQVSTASSYKTAAKSLKEFAQRDFSFQEVNQDFLKRYQAKMLASGVSQTTVSIYLRCLRTVFNRAIEGKIISADLYPFGKRRFHIQAVQSNKRSLGEDDKNRLLAYRGKYQKAVDFWMFSYYCNGMNMADVCKLKRGQLVDGVLYLLRAKTMKTAKVMKKIEIPLREEALEVIARYGNKSLNPEEYVFPVLREGLTAQQMRYKIQHFTAEINEGLREVAKDLGLGAKLTTYTARHTFANISLLKGASKEFIQEALGHQSIMTTESYISGFDMETKKKMSGRL